jgi:uncharacterized protein (TIGR00725 family)
MRAARTRLRRPGRGARRRPRLQVAVCGGGSCPPAVGRTAASLGAALAAAGAVVVCGGLGGETAAVERGARRRGGLVVGVLPGYDRRAANPYLSAVAPTGLRHARNVVVAAAGDVLVALPGGPGTLSEIAIALKLGRPVVGLGAWKAIAGVHHATSIAGAMRLVRALARGPLRSRSP